MSENQGFYEAFIKRLYTVAQDEGYPEIINEIDDYYDCRNCCHYKHSKKICRLAQLGQACDYQPLKKVDHPAPAVQKGDVRSRW
jgi:hypothetical protein